MFYRNGSSEARAFGYDAAYQAATADLTQDDLRVCSDDLVGPLNPFTTWTWAQYGGAEWNDYWEERRHLPDVLENYEGSVYLVWGLQDWNVDPYRIPNLSVVKRRRDKCKSNCWTMGIIILTNRIDTVHFQVVMEPKHIQTCLEWIGLLSYTIGLDIT